MLLLKFENLVFIEFYDITVVSRTDFKRLVYTRAFPQGPQ